MKLPGLDGLRALAIGLVFLLHLSTGLKRAIPALDHPHLVFTLAGAGGVGVALFFAVSGFLVALPFTRGTYPDLKTYARRRLWRILPPYWLVLLIAFAGQIVMKMGTVSELLPSLLASALFLHNILYGIWSKVLPVAWSLEIEVQFYVVAPLLGRLYAHPRAETLFFGLAFAGGVLSAIANPVLAKLHLDRSLFSEGHFFLLGMGLAGRFTRLGKLADSGWHWDFAGIVGLAVMLLNWGKLGQWTQIGVQLATLVSITGLFLGALHGRICQSIANAGAPLGMRCYSLYLLHYPMLTLMLPLTKKLPMPGDAGLALLLQAIVIGLPILGATEAFYRTVELPCQKYGRNSKEI
ncbi:MAG: acyltransferase [Armatimonas sp.]